MLYFAGLFQDRFPFRPPTRDEAMLEDDRWRLSLVETNPSTEESYMARIAINASPFSCRWIARGSEMRMDQDSRMGQDAYAICVRVDPPKVVSESECAHCLLWDAVDEHDSGPARSFTA